MDTASQIYPDWRRRRIRSIWLWDQNMVSVGADCYYNACTFIETMQQAAYML